MKAVVGLLLLVFAVGCGGGKGVIEGEVTLDGKLLEKGMISFVPEDGKTTPADGPIEAGKFKVTVSAGKKIVKISAPKVVGKTRMAPESPEVDQIEELLPTRYNANSELKLDFTGGTLNKRFELTSKP